MSAIEAYAQLLKTAASGERPHSMIPGRTTGSKRGTAGTLAPTSNPIRVEPLEEEEPKKPKAPKAPRAPKAPKAPGTPKVDISFSVKVGSQQDITAPSVYDPQPPPEAQGNTGANVDGSFQPDSQIGGSYGTTSLPEERDLMRTPALPFGGEGDSEYVGDIKISEVIDYVQSKMSEAQPPLPLPEEISEEDEGNALQRLLRKMKQQNPEFYAKQASYRMAKSGAEDPDALDRRVAGGIAATGMAAPFMGMIGEKKIVGDPYYNSKIKQMSREEIMRMAQPGDIAITGRRSGLKFAKNPQLWSTGSEFFHAEPILAVGPDGPVTMEAGLYDGKSKYKGDTPERILKNKKGTPLSERFRAPGQGAPYEDMVLVRPKKKMTPAQLKSYQTSLIAGGKKSYSTPQSIKAWLKDMFIPKIKGVTGKIAPFCSANTGICSTVPAESFEEVMGSPITAGKHSRAVMPGDFLRADSPFEAVGASIHNKNRLVSPGRRLAKQIAFRGALGTGLATAGVGTYGLLRHLNRSDKEPKE